MYWSDWDRSCVAAGGLLGVAALAVFKIPRGFEEGVGWYLILLPGAFFAAGLSDFLARAIPRANSLVFGSLALCFNFIWYFLLCFIFIKVYRFISGAAKDLSSE
jgi:hypothetical protein